MTLEELCKATYEDTDARARLLRQRTRQAPLIRLHDGNMQLQHVVRAENSQEWEDVDNDSAPGVLKLDFELPEAQWLWDLKGRRDRGETINLFVTVDHVGRRWSGPLVDATVETNELGHTELTANFVSDYEQLKWRNLWANPALPAGFQFPKVFILAGPTPWVGLTGLYLNLKRAHGGNTVWFDDPMADEARYGQNNWPIVVVPRTFNECMQQGYVWSVLASRFKNWHEGMEMALRDGELSVQWRRWLTGDPPPWEGANIRHGALVVDIVDKSGVLEGTANGGTIFDGLTRFIRDFVNDFFENEDSAITGIPESADYMKPGYLSTDPRLPFVFFGPRHPGMKKQKSTWTPAKGLELTVGGHSMPMVNEIIEAGIQAAGDLTAMIPGVPPIGGALSAILKPLFEDVVLAWMSVRLIRRMQASGDFALYERVLDAGARAWTLSTLMVIRTGMVESQTDFSCEMEIIDSAPYVIGAPGFGHFDKGDRVLSQAVGDKTRRVQVQRVKKLTLKSSDGEAPHYDIALGEQYKRGDPIQRIIDAISRTSSVLQEVGAM